MTIRSSFLATMSGWPGAAWAPLAMVPVGESAGGASASPYGDSELKSFAVAAVRVQRINDAYVRKMEEAKSVQEKQQLEQRASGEMMQAVKNEGLTVDKYRDIANRVQTDPDLAERVKQKLRDVA
jgi:hypothetical protein